MAKYNELMSRPRANLNGLLAWQHATALTMQALEETAGEMGPAGPVHRAAAGAARARPARGSKNFELRMRTHAEEDPVVAAASVVARAEFVRQMHELSRQFGAKLQKGAGAVAKAQAAEIVQKLGAPALGSFAKLHFRTAYEVVKAAGKLDELPLPVPKEKIAWD